MVSTPRPPDPAKTAAAQSGMNLDTALTQQLTNMVDQSGPWGSTTYSQNGNSTFTDSTGRVVSVPRFTQNTTYSPAQQAIMDKTTQAQTNLAQLAVDQSGKMSEYLAKPFEFNNQSAADWAYDLASSRIRPQQQQNRADLDTRLVNAGLRPGTAAYDREMTRLDQADTDQMNQLALTGRSQAFGEAVQTRNQPINELTAFLSGSQVAGPNSGFSATPQAQVGGVDYAGLVNSNYQTKVGQSNALMGGLFGLAGAGVSAFAPQAKLSDRRFKTNIKRVGTLDNGLAVYSYTYAWGGPPEIGVTAQEVEEVRPDAVYEIEGMKLVNYELAVSA